MAHGTALMGTCFCLLNTTPCPGACRFYNISHFVHGSNYSAARATFAGELMTIALLPHISKLLRLTALPAAAGFVVCATSLYALAYMCGLNY